MSEEKVVLDDVERQKCEVWTRVMGYHRPVQSFNIGKKGEFAERKYFSEAKALRKLRHPSRSRKLRDYLD